MTVKEFSRTYFAMGSYTDRLEVRVKGLGCTLYSDKIDSEIYMLPQVQEMQIESWTIHGKKIMVFVNSDKTFIELLDELRGEKA